MMTFSSPTEQLLGHKRPHKCIKFLHIQSSLCNTQGLVLKGASHGAYQNMVMTTQNQKGQSIFIF